MKKIYKAIYSQIYNFQGELVINKRFFNRSFYKRLVIENEDEVSQQTVAAPKPFLYISIFGAWLFCLAWFDPRLFKLLHLSNNWMEFTALLFFILFVNMAWLYGIYNICIVIFALCYKWFARKKNFVADNLVMDNYPSVAVLYTTCNDFVEESVLSCIQLNYPSYSVYILDDSTDIIFKNRVDHFAEKYPTQVKVVRREGRKSFKAGNLNHCLSTEAILEPYFAIADADEILPVDFLQKIIPILESDPLCGFVQANHCSNPHDTSKLANSVGMGVDVHWNYYQPLRNDFGFIMFLGHGAVLRRECWVKVNGFPDIVSEDLGYAINIREAGYRGKFAEDVVCYENFPETVRAFRVRHMKWTKGTTEFLIKMTKPLLKAKNVSVTEKLDILFPTLNLPLTLVYFLFMINTNILLPILFGRKVFVTWVFAGKTLVMPVMMLRNGFQVIYSHDFYFITLLTFLSPVICFIVSFINRPLKLFKFLSHSTVLYTALAPLSSIGVVAYMATKKAVFLVTGDTKKINTDIENDKISVFQKIRKKVVELFRNTHPDEESVQLIEITIGVVFAVLSIITFQLSCLGLSLSFILLPFLHHVKWNNSIIRVLVYIPFIFIISGIILMSLSAFGIQSVFFGYGFHF